jgi:hypothetical protein
MAFQRRIRDVLSVTLRTSSGHKFRGEFGSPNAFPRPRQEIQNLPHRSLVTSSQSIVKGGDLVAYQGVDYILCGQHHLGKTMVFLAVEITHWLPWKRNSEIIDSVTLMKKDYRLETLNPLLPVTIDPQRALNEADFQLSQYRMLTSAAIQVGDFLGEHKVIQVFDLFGMTMVEAA